MAVDPLLTRAVKLLLSNEADATDQLRAMLDDALKNKYGVGLPQTLCKEDSGSKKDRKSFDYVASSTKYNASSAAQSEVPNDIEADDSFAINLNLLEEDLTCVVCRQLNVGVRNQLVECCDCHSLYHQDCHSPPIKEIKDSWLCSKCSKKKHSTTSTSNGGAVPNAPAPIKEKGSESTSTSGSSSAKSKSSSKSSKGSSSSSSSHSEHRRHSSSSSHRSSHHKSRHAR